MRKDIFRAIAILISINKKVFSKKPIDLVFYQEQYYPYTKSFKSTSINFLYFKISFPDAKTKSFSKTWLHYIDLASEIDESLS